MCAFFLFSFSLLRSAAQPNQKHIFPNFKLISNNWNEKIYGLLFWTDFKLCTVSNFQLMLNGTHAKTHTHTIWYMLNTLLQNYTYFPNTNLYMWKCLHLKCGKHESERVKHPFWWYYGKVLYGVFLLLFHHILFVGRKMEKRDKSFHKRRNENENKWISKLNTISLASDEREKARAKHLWNS